MSKNGILAAVSALALLSSAAVQADEADHSAQASADWRALHDWFGSQTGDRAAGANYWAANRNASGHLSCTDAASNYKMFGDQTMFAAGCQEAKRRLDPIDDRRHTDPQYRFGFSDAAKRLPLQANAPDRAAQVPVMNTPLSDGDAGVKSGAKPVDTKPVEAPSDRVQSAYPVQTVPWQCNAPRMTGYNGPYGVIQGPTGQPYVMGGPMLSIMAQDIDRRNQQDFQAALQAQREKAEKERQYYAWLDQQKKQAEAEQQEKLKQEEEAARQAAEAQRQREASARKAAEQNRAADAAGGYTTVSFDDFQLDGKKLADEETKIAMEGVYAKDGEMERLYPSLSAYYMSRQEIDRQGVPVLTDDASREFRQLLLHCTFPQACAVHVRGKTTWCTLTNAFGVTKQAPCLAADEGNATSAR